MLSFIKNLFTGNKEANGVVSVGTPLWLPKNLPAKDPKDLSLTPSSTPWQNQRYWCKSCKTNRSHQENMADTCNGCGSYYKIDTYGCNIRKIWNGKKWVTQYNERSNKSWLSE